MADQQWHPPAPFGHPAAIQNAASVAAPILAGFGVTVIALVLPTVDAAGDKALTRWPEALLVLLLCSVGALIGTVQAAIEARRYQINPADLRDWVPEWFPAGKPPLPVAGTEQRSFARECSRWSEVARSSYHVGILLLLGGLSILTVPPAPITGGRWVVIVCASSLWLAELAWIVRGMDADVEVVDVALVVAADLAAVAGITIIGVDRESWLATVAFTAAAVLLLAALVDLVRRSKRVGRWWSAPLQGLALVFAVLAVALSPPCDSDAMATAAVVSGAMTVLLLTVAIGDAATHAHRRAVHALPVEA